MVLRQRQERRAFLRRYEAALDDALHRTPGACADTLARAHPLAVQAAAASFERQGRRPTDDLVAELEWLCLRRLAQHVGVTSTEAARRCIVVPWHVAFDQSMRVHLDRLNGWGGPDASVKRAIAFALSEQEASAAVPGSRGREVARSLKTAMIRTATTRWCPIPEPSTHDLNVFYFAAMAHAGQRTAQPARVIDRSTDAGIDLSRLSLCDAVSAGR